MVLLLTLLAADMNTTPGVVVYVQGQVKIVRPSGELVAILGAEVRESDTLVTEAGLFFLLFS